jgi:alpha-glucosidase
MKKIKLIIVFLFCTTLMWAGNKPPQIVSENARFTVLTPELIRLEWSANGTFEDHATLAFINRDSLPEVPHVKLQENKNNITITTDKLTLKYTKGARFNEKNLSITFTLNKKKTTWYPGLQDPDNLKGTMRTLDDREGWQDDNLEQGIVSRSGWALVDDSKRPLLLPDTRWEHWVAPRDTTVERLDWYFFGYGHDYKKALYDFTQVAGKIPLPPKFAFGYWWSRYWQYTDNELKDLVNTIKSFNIPLDVLIVDMDWHKTWGLSLHNTIRDAAGGRMGWTGYSWDKNVFPSPELFFDWAKKQHLKTALNLHPASGIQPMEDVYDNFAKAYDWDTTGRKYIPFNIDNKKWANTYFDEVLHPIEKQGADFWWLDWQQYDPSKNIKGLTNTFWLNHTFFNDMKGQGKNRPLLFHRWGGLGNHRYQIGFSGDSFITWGSLSFQPYFTATAANVGYGYWSHDIGGHYGDDANDPELYLRWLQYGAFSPILRTHSTKSSEIERRIWKYPNHFEYMRDVLQLRYQMVPYIYNAARQSYDSGISLCRPLYYDYPETDYAYSRKNQYMFGDNLLVAPIITPADSASGLSEVEIWLPQGTWYEMATGTLLTGGNKLLKRHFIIDEIPYYAKAGSIIPMNPTTVKNLQTRCDTLSLCFVPGADGQLTYYEDDETTDAYTTEFAQTNIKKVTNATGEEVKITIAARTGKYNNMSAQKAYELVLPVSFPPVSVEVNGTTIPFTYDAKPNAWTYDGFGLAAKIVTGKLPCDKEATITLHYSKEQVAQKQLLNNKVKLFHRFVPVTIAFKYLYTEYDQIWNLTTEYLGISQTPSFINANPEKTVEYLQYFEANFDGALKQIEEFKGDKPAEIQKLLRTLKN